MKIAVSAMGKTPDSQFNPRFGRASGFVVYDTDSQAVQYLDNENNISRSQGAGISTAKMIADAGADVLITGQMGPKAAQVISQANLKVYVFSSGTVNDAITAFQENRLDIFTPDKVQAGPGKMGGRGMGGGGGRGMGGGGRGGGRRQ